MYYGIVRRASVLCSVFWPFAAFTVEHNLIVHMVYSCWSFHEVQAERYIGSHGPAIRDAEGWKLIVNGAGGVHADKHFCKQRTRQSWLIDLYRLILSERLRYTQR